MATELSTYAEQQAQHAEVLPAFDQIKLLGIKRKVAEMLLLIGREGVFDQYTKHDISHIDAMLQSLEWLIPAPTREEMRPADWLMIVLAVYFHDIGLLVTKDEFERRKSSGFREFCDRVLFAGSEGTDYQHKISRMATDEADRFLYQEFVRANHAARIRAWVAGKAPESFGITDAVAKEVYALIEPLGAQFLRDLGLICESHHLDDLDDFKKYKVSQPYGNSDNETCNVHFAAIILRTADLLHITKDRTPSIAFRIINPTDPISQQEWAKQMAVKRVRPKVGLNREGTPDDNAPRDTIEVHAFFSEPDGFFGLTSYLVYVKGQLEKSHSWTQDAKRRHASRYDFPWKYIDDEHIETEGFLRDSFEFTLDQGRILDLLTGHTLYNQTDVVLRELVQNSIDAIRLQQTIDAESGKNVFEGEIIISWDSNNRILAVQDNGTGMTQSEIERNLLRVGASRYQDPAFKERFPKFSAISRFGIGILSTFMIADQVEIVTCHPEEEEARSLALRSVHGRYLVRLLDKTQSDFGQRLVPHGTMVRLSLRASATLEDIIQTCRKWVVFPGCRVVVVAPDGSKTNIGYPDPAAALCAYLSERGYNVGPDTTSNKSHNEMRVVQKKSGAITIAYALRWSEYFAKWSFVDMRELSQRSRRDAMALGTCIEGVRVEFTSPGFSRDGIVAIANATGPQAPKTNVARSGIETTAERDAMLSAIYSMYAGHVQEEFLAIHQQRQYSLTWAAQEASYTLSQLLNGEVLAKELLDNAIRLLTLVVIEENRAREAKSLVDIDKLPVFWTVTSQLFTSAESLMREARSDSSMGTLIDALHVDSILLPSEPIVATATPRSVPEKYLFSEREIDRVSLVRSQRRLDLRWCKADTDLRWIAPDPESIPRTLYDHFNINQSFCSVWIGVREVDLDGVTTEVGFRVSGGLYLLYGTALAAYLVKVVKRGAESIDPEAVILPYALTALLHRLPENRREDHLSLDNAKHWIEHNITSIFRNYDLSEFVDAFNSQPFNIFDPSAWVRKTE